MALLAGCAGPPGAPGAPGAMGVMGSMGAMGAAGPAGETGFTGMAGATGPAGATGYTGMTGATGPAGPAGPAGATGASATAAARDLVAKVVAYRSSILDVICTSNNTHGSGTKTPNGLVVTAFHVMDGCTKVEYYAEGQQLVGAGGLYEQPIAGRDLALVSQITWTAQGAAIPGVPNYAGLWTPTIGAATVLASYPGSLLSDIQFSYGLVTDESITLSAADAVFWSGAFITDSDGTHGSSGAPMFDDAGRWVAIVVGQIEEPYVIDLRIMIPLRFK